MAYTRIELPKPDRIEHAVVLDRWAWFRSQLKQIYGIYDLPGSFRETDGEIQVYERVDEDDPRFDLTAPEYNYSSRSQTIRFELGTATVVIHVDKSDLGDHFRFEYKVPSAPGADVTYFAAFYDCYLGLDDASPAYSGWRRAVGSR